MFRSFYIDYKQTRTELCKIGAKYDTDKSSQRTYADDIRHCHPYTCFYHSLFRSARYRAQPIQLCELGILQGASLKMWREYFPRVFITAFEYNSDYIQQFIECEYENVPAEVQLPPVDLFHIDVSSRANIAQQFAAAGKTYDIIIEDTTHQFPDQINVALETIQYVAPGGVLIIEDVFLKYNEADYATALLPIMDQIQDAYFVQLDHANRISTGWDNDKLLVLVRKGAPPQFQSHQKLTVITPSVRPENIYRLYQTLQMEYVHKWYIVYDGSRIAENPLLFLNSHPQITEIVYTATETSACGNAQRNHILDIIERDQSCAGTYLYYLDDDNIVHPNLYVLLDKLDDGRIYTFDSVARLGNEPSINKIDTAQFLADISLVRGLRWVPYLYNADGHYIENACYLNREKWVYVNAVMAYYNYLV
jgi:hypothetical protein